MSSVATIPPPNSSSVLRHVPRLTARARALLTAMNLHFAGVAALTVLMLYFAGHLLIVSRALSASNADALDSERAQLRAAEIAAKPLRGLDAKLVNSTADADQFYGRRLPYVYSQVLTELGILTRRENVRLARVQYAQTPALSGGGALTELRMDASISGDYRAVVQFINAVERDRTFFVINGVNFTGQQNGQVNLRLRLTTYLRAANPDEMANELTASATAASAVPATTGGAQ